MTLVIKAIEEDDFPTSFADWLELKTISSPDHVVNVLELRDLLDLEGAATDGEGIEPSEASENLGFDDMPTRDLQDVEEKIEQVLGKAFEEIQYRTRSLGASYPFTLQQEGYQLALSGSLSFGAYVYLFCLIISNYNSSGLIESSSHRPSITNHERDLFQICATIGAAGVNQGPAVSIGWPRSDGSRLLDKLRAVHQPFHPIIIVREKPLPGASPHEKDGGIDVLSWKLEQDGHAGMRYFMGQAASGHDWTGKSAKGEISKFCDAWFEAAPAKPSPQMYIPHCVTGVRNPAERFRVCADREIQTQTTRLGFICHRYRLPKYTEVALTLGADIQQKIERLKDRQQVVDWVNSYLENAPLAA